MTNENSVHKFEMNGDCLVAYEGPGGDIIIPESVRVIGKNSFRKKLGLYTYENNKEIRSIVLPESVECIEESAFNGCVNLETINIPNSVHTIEENAFSNCSALRDNQGFVIVGGILFNYYGLDEEVLIPKNVTRIGDFSFYKQNIKKVVIPNTVKVIGAAFLRCTKLEEVLISEGVTEIKQEAFEGCESLFKLHLPKSVTKIGHSAFRGCKSLTELTIPEGVEEISPYAFCDCARITKIELPNSLKTIYQYAFSGCEHLPRLVVPANIESIAAYAFQKCSCLQLFFENKDFIFDPYAFKQCYGMADENGFVILDGFLNDYIGNGGDITIPMEVCEILPEAFRGNKKINSVSLPSSVKSIGEKAFMECDNLKIVHLTEGLEKIGKEVFGGCGKLKEITIPASVTEIGAHAFGGCEQLEKVEVHPNNHNYATDNDVLFNKEQTELIYCSGGKRTEYAIPNCVNTVLERAFSDCHQLQRLSIPENVQNIGENAFVVEHRGHTTRRKTVQFFIDNIEVDINLKADLNDKNIFCFEDEDTPIVYPKFPIELIKDSKIQDRLALGYCETPTKYEGEYKVMYEKYVKSHMKTLLKKATKLKLDGALEYFKGLETDEQKPRNYKKLSDLAKVELLEKTVLENDVENLKTVIEECESFEFTARALGLASLYGGLDKVKLLVESGATFKYEYTPTLKKKYGAAHSTGQYTYPAEYSLMIASTEVDGYITALFSMSKEWHFGKLPHISIKRINQEIRADIVEYLVQNREKCGFEAEKVLYYSVLWGCDLVAERLRSLGVQAPMAADILTTTATSYERGEVVAILPQLSPEKCLYALKTFNDLVLAKTENKMIFVQKVFEERKSTFFNAEILRFLVEHTDTSKITKAKVLEEIVNRENIAALDILTNAGWIKGSAQREKIIKYAGDKQKKEALAYLIEYKNNNVDFTKEAKKEEEKMRKELTAKPNSVSELKKIWSSKKLADGSLMITKYLGMDTEIEVPDAIGKAKVTAIGESAFLVPFFHDSKITNLETRKNITKVIIPEGVTEIGKYAFANCEKLERVKLPTTLECIKRGAFSHCINLNELIIDKTFKNFEESAFSKCLKLADEKGFIIVNGVLVNYVGNEEDIIIPEAVTEIGEAAFKDANIRSVEIPSCVKTVKKNAFYNCRKMTQVIIAEGVENIMEYAFYCSNMVTMVLPSTIKHMASVFGILPPYNLVVHAPKNSYAASYIVENYGSVVIVDIKES